MSPLDEVKKFLEKLDESHINFKRHFFDKIKERPISEELVRSYLKKIDKLERVEKQLSKKRNEKKYKVWFKMSNKYNLVIIATISEKDINIITSWNTNRKWQKSIQK